MAGGGDRRRGEPLARFQRQYPADDLVDRALILDGSGPGAHRVVGVQENRLRISGDVIAESDYPIVRKFLYSRPFSTVSSIRL